MLTLWAVSHSRGGVNLDVSLAGNVDDQVIPFEIIVRRLDHHQIKNVGPDSSTDRLTDEEEQEKEEHI